MSPRSVQRLLVLLGFVALVFSIGAAPAAYSRTPSDSVVIANSFESPSGRVISDADGAKSTKGKSCPFRNCVCHAHYVAAIYKQPTEATPKCDVVERVAMRTSMREGAASSPALRPPAA